MNKQQLDKSKDQIVFSPLLISPPTQTTTAHHQPPLPESPRYFLKFVEPHHGITSAFRLYSPRHSSEEQLQHKKSEIARKHRGNYRKYTVVQKQEAVKQIMEGIDAKQISEKYGIPRRNLLRWKKNGCERKEGGGRPTDGEMEITLYTKIESRQITTEKEIRAQAKRLSKMVDFKASKGWYCKFSRRYNQWKRQKSQCQGEAVKEGIAEGLLLEPSEDSSQSDNSSSLNQVGCSQE